LATNSKRSSAARAFAEFVDQQLLRWRLRLGHELAQVAAQLQSLRYSPAGNDQRRQPQQCECKAFAGSHVVGRASLL
jgi:hypothetical protein